MKIRKIRFKNINSLRGEHEIDFTVSPLSESRLFAITGPTGSGKSTILDVIALALFNRVPRLGRVSKNFVAQSGALLTRNTDNAFASVEYKCAKGIFRSSWSITTSRNNTLRDYEMELVDLVTKRVLDLKKSDVPGKNEELIGLNYDQFVKSIMLAQGEFAQFLKVNKSERGELLEKITGTGIYRELGKKAYEKKNVFAKALEDLRNEVSIHEDYLFKDDELKDAQKANAELEKETLEKEKRLKVLEEQLKLREEIKKQEQQIQLKEKRLKYSIEMLNTFQENYGGKLKNHEATSAFAEKLEDWKRNLEKTEAALQKAEKLKKEKVEMQSKRDEQLGKICELLQVRADPKNVKVALEQFQEQVEMLEGQIVEKQQDYKGKKSELIAKGESWGFTPSKPDPETEWKELEVLKEETESEFKTLEAKLEGISLENPELENTQFEKKLYGLRQAQQWSSQLEKVQNNVDQERKVLHKNEVLRDELPDIIDKLENEKEKDELSVKALRLELDNQNLRASLEDKRAKLQDGISCPLCGSIHHPWSIHAPQADNALNKKLAEVENKLRMNSEALFRSKEQFKNLQKEIEELEKRINNLQSESKELHHKLKSEYGEWLKDDPVNWENLIEQTEVQRKSLKELMGLQKKAKGIHNCLPVLEEMIEISKEGKKLTVEKNKRFGGKNISKTCGDFRDSWQKINFKISSLDEQISMLESEQEDLKTKGKQLFDELTPALRERGFEGIEDAISKRLQEEKYNQLNREFSNLKEVSNKAETELKSLNERLSEQKVKLTYESFEILSEMFDSLKTELSEIRDNWEEVKRKLKNHKETQEKIQKLLVRIREEEKTGRKWELLNQLIGDASGKKFNDFAQDLTLQQLLVLANKRLSMLSDRYRVASPQEEEDDSLIAIDDHMGGHRRSVKTLSGGETFVLSLSLALGLSDLASKNVEINSLFIDEGFGTLDPETLDQTLDTLEKLQTESSKTIGIISHVEALKERISTQIQLERNGQGYSSLKVF